MKILAIDTTEAGCSAAYWQDAEVSSRFELAPRQHSELILPMVDDVLNTADISLHQLDGLAFSRGPGSFTGLRIAAGVIQGLALAADLPVFPVSSLQTLAQQAHRVQGSMAVLSALDARMKEVYWGAFLLDSKGLMQPCAEESIRSPTAVEIPEGEGWHGVGSGWSAYQSELTAAINQPVDPVFPDTQCHAQDVAHLAALQWDEDRLVKAEMAQPVYLRNQVAQKMV